MTIGLILAGGSAAVVAAIAFIVRRRHGNSGVEPTGFNNPAVSEDWWTEIPHAKPSETKEWYEGP